VEEVVEEDNPPQVVEEEDNPPQVVEEEDNPPQTVEGEDKQTPQQHPTSDSAETPQKYSREIEKKQIAFSPSSNATI
jgi:hypothetical protein